MLKPDLKLPETDDLLALFLNDIPLLDVRAPVEFEEGAFPCAKNHPLIDDQERHQIGKTYKGQGQDAAIELGVRLVSGDNKAQRIAAWEAFAKAHPEGVLYCFRGGMRSKIAQQWLYEASGIRYRRVTGGYKALRRFLIDQLEENSPKIRPVVVGGRTGCGKTRFLNTLTPHLDLEHLAWHRGSAFGKHATPQPSQIDFENALSIAVIKLLHNGNPYFVTEDESRAIGARHMPKSFFGPLSEAPVIVLEASIEERIAVTRQEYVYDGLKEHQALHGNQAGFESWAENLNNSLLRIERRLGGENYKKIHQVLNAAIGEHRSIGDSEKHDVWIRMLLSDYYDAMYSYQLEQKNERIDFVGGKNEVKEFLQKKYAINNI